MPVKGKEENNCRSEVFMKVACGGILSLSGRNGLRGKQTLQNMSVNTVAS